MSTVWLNVVGFVMMFGGLWLISGEVPVDVPRHVAIGLIVAGLGLGVFYLDAILLGHVDIHARDSNERSYVVVTYTGAAARLFGVLMLAVGAVVVVAGAVELVAPGSVWPWLRSPTGIGTALLGAGVAAGARAGLSLVYLVTTAATRTTAAQHLNRLPSYLVLAVMATASVVLIVLGTVQLARPGALERTVEDWFDDKIGPLPTAPPLPGDPDYTGPSTSLGDHDSARTAPTSG